MASTVTGDIDYIYEKSGEICEDFNTEFAVTEENVIQSRFPRDVVIKAIKQVAEEFQLPYKLQNFQIEAIYHVVNGRNIIIISPPGSGKMVIIYISIRVKEILLATEFVALGSEPTQHIIKARVT